jgi:hypothetical protein
MRQDATPILAPCTHDPLGILDPLAYISAMTTEDDNDLPPLPAFLDRKKWTQDMWQKAEKTAERVFAAHRAELAALQEKAQRAKESKKIKEAMDAQRALERKAVLAQREQKRVVRQACLAYVRRALDRGTVTANGLRQGATDGTKDLVPWALRTMLKTGEIKKVSRQTYQRREKK